MAINMANLGLGKHATVVPEKNQFKIAKLSWICYFLFNAGTSSGKSSALFFYSRIFSNAKLSFKYTIWVTQLVLYLWFIGISIGMLLACKPIQKYWNPLLPGSCTNESTMWLASVIPSIVIDFVILLLPLPLLWNLQMKRNRKILITGMFVCGYLYETTTDY